jgi:hypothetical protein
VTNACGVSFFDGVLNQRLVDDRQHLFRLGFGRGQKSGAESGNWENGFSNSGALGHVLPVIGDRWFYFKVTQADL